MRIPSVPTGTEEMDDYVAKSGVWLLYEAQLLNEERFAEMTPPQKEHDDGK